MTTIDQHWHAVVILQSLVLAFMGAYSAITLAEQHRISAVLKSKFLNQQAYLVLMAISVGGAAIWCMHFVGMGAVTLSYKENGVKHKIKPAFDVGLTCISFVTCVVCVYVGLYISSRDKMFVRDKKEIFEMIVAESKGDSMKAVRSKHYLLRVALFRGVGPLVAGGVFTGGGVCIMHYIGMTALVADIDVHWNVGVVVASIIIAVVASTAAFWILFRLLALYPKIESLRIASAVVMALAVNGMHYTGMAAAGYDLNLDPASPAFKTAVDGHKAFTFALVSGLAFNWLVGAFVQTDLRGWYSYLHPQVKDSRKLVQALRETYGMDQTLAAYEKKVTKVSNTYEVGKSSTAMDHSTIDSNSNNDAKVYAEEDLEKGLEFKN